MKNNIDKIRISLPDYIKGNINDYKEIERIEREIENNPDFKKEYRELKESMYFLESVKLIEPPDHYFNTILPRLNKSIEKKKAPGQNIFSFLRLKKYYWGYLVPVIPILIMFLIYSEYFNDFNSNENPVYILNDTKSYLKSIDSGITKNENTLITKSNNFNDSANDNESTSNGNDAIIDYNSFNINRDKNDIDNTEDIDAENIEASDVFSKDEDDFNNLQSQFNQLDDDSQNDILDNLKNEKL